MENKLDINKFANALAKAITVSKEKEYPGLTVTVKSVRPVSEVKEADKSA